MRLNLPTIPPIFLYNLHKLPKRFLLEDYLSGVIITTQPPTDNLTQTLQSPEAAIPAQVEMCDNFVDDDGDGWVDFDYPAGCCSPA